MAVPAVVTSGAPHASASRAGKPKPSSSEGYTTATRAAQQRRHGLLGHIAEAPDPLAGVRMCDRRQRGRGLPTGPTGKHEAELGPGGSHEVKGRDEVLDSLSRLQGPEMQQVGAV